VHSVGLTGNVASGKSTVADLFAGWGGAVISADALVREVQQPGSPVLAAIADRFGARVIRSDGTLDRRALRSQVLARPEERVALEAIVHPAVQQLRAARLTQARARGARVVVHDIPLLFEALNPDEFDTIVVVDAEESVRRDRLTRLRGFSDDEADQLLAAQMPSAPKRAQADFVIDNNGSPQHLERAARDVWIAILERAEEPVDRP
jgi:dephospho-CoA kinase